MGERRQRILLYFLSLALSLFLMGHYLIVEIEFEACFGNMAASVSGQRPYLRVAEMSFGQLAYSAARAISAEHLILAAFGLLPLSPFLLAWSVARDKLSRQLWVASAIAAFIVILGWTATRDLADFYDCDLNGVSLGIMLAPILYTAATMAAALAFAGVRSVVLSALGRE